jgi:hypothetical protein
MLLRASCFRQLYSVFKNTPVLGFLNGWLPLFDRVELFFQALFSCTIAALFRGTISRHQFLKPNLLLENLATDVITVT